MKRFYNKEAIESAISQSRYRDILKNLNVPMFICEYEDGEIVVAPFHESSIFQITISGSLSIYFVRNDGSSYHLAYSEMDSFLGENELFDSVNCGVYGEASGIRRCLAFPISESKQALLENAAFLRVLAKILDERLNHIALQDAVSTSLTERVISYMTYICKDKTLKGIEKNAYQLHCSSKQLQRILNSLEQTGIVKKIGKGSYTMI
ncbi:hypothetical protein BXO88_10100 [Oribacterium sp. C9]|uniref:Crp/Fnr family transcriptional regulator n=1 Tax=Oribacterium sp. C9 TaxID=1943579 RepID=UPI0009901A27|nr:Crp/Fnr family transcriptional regulator [Oribacterium sp. C9]OON85969.1 hypothetical protein BXO88_10100 [Oribacterium sp. C9]